MIREIIFFTPLEGIVTNKFDPKEDHFGIDIVSQENEPIKALADGIVIMASWTLDGGYVLVIQHTGSLISIYKHNSELIKSVGNIVTSGEVVSFIGNTGELTSGPHLHFEIRAPSRHCSQLGLDWQCRESLGRCRLGCERGQS